jgi:hypothetical protein
MDSTRDNTNFGNSPTLIGESVTTARSERAQGPWLGQANLLQTPPNDFEGVEDSNPAIFEFDLVLATFDEDC